MEEIAILAGLAFAINKTVSVVKAALNKDVNAAVTQLVVWVVGFIAISLAAHAQLTENLVVPGLLVPLDELDWQSLVLVAWILGGTGSFAFDFKKALDSSDSAAEPSLLHPSGAHTTTVVTPPPAH
jgi:energy-converting hydrogenase Eha subunit G